MRPETGVNRFRAEKEARIRVFVRQPFTESGEREQAIVQSVLDVLGSLNLEVLTGLEAQSQATFRASFERNTGLPFTPRAFRDVRLGLLDHADAIIFIRTSLSESGAFEAAYNIFGGRRAPMFFAVWRHAPIKTTLLQELDEFCPTDYVTFEHPDELRPSLSRFLNQLRKKATGHAFRAAASQLPSLGYRRKSKVERRPCPDHALYPYTAAVPFNNPLA